MHPILRHLLALLAGWIAGSAVNMALVQVGFVVFPIPGLVPGDTEAMAEIMPTLEAQFFLFPFLAHALGTLVGAAIAATIAKNNKLRFAWVIGLLFLLGGIAASFMIPAPAWFVAVDLLLAYLPMAWLGGSLAIKRTQG